VLDTMGFQYNIPASNLGEIIVTYTKLWQNQNPTITERWALETRKQVNLLTIELK
jgi:hypothetical protein